MRFDDMQDELLKNPYRSLGRLPYWDEGVWIKAVDDVSAKRGQFRVSIKPFLVKSNMKCYGFEVYFPNKDEIMSDEWEINHCL